MAKTLLLLSLLLFAKLNGKGAFQVWNTDTLHVRVGRKTQFIGQTEFRYGKKGKKLFYKHYQVGLNFIRTPHIQIHTSYRQVYLRRFGNWEAEYHPFIDLLLHTGPSRGWHISDRNRIVCRILGKTFDKHHRWVYRNRLLIMPPIRLTPSQIAPYLANEFFWEESRGIDQNRLEAGFRIPYHKRTLLELSYMLRHIKNPQKKWTHQNVFWIHFSLFF